LQSEGIESEILLKTKENIVLQSFHGRTPLNVTLTFLNSTKLGKQYENDMFVGDFHNGLANIEDELKQVIFGERFGAITDIKVGPDGYLYVMSLHDGGPNCDPKHQEILCFSYSSVVKGAIYKIVRLK
jgi:glucose/arabinose dehydrogenase